MVVIVSDGAAMVAGMDPVLMPGEFVFVTVADEAQVRVLSLIHKQKTLRHACKS